MPAEFDRFADRYEDILRDPVRDSFHSSPDFFHRRKWLLIDRFLTRSGLDPRSLSWLDIGCGKGDLLRLARHRFLKASGCEPSPAMAAAAPDLDVRLQDSPVSVPYPDATFDFATAVCVYHHIPGPARSPITRDIYRVLRPGGIFCIIEHNPWNPVTRSIVRRTPVDAAASLLSEPEARLSLSSAGFYSITSEFFLYLPETLFNRAAFLESWLSRLPLGGQYAAFARKPA